MPTARTKAGPGEARVLDFKKAYAQVHGKEPEVPAQPSSIRVPSPPKGMFRNRQSMKERLDALAAKAEKRGKRVVAEFNLEDPEGKRGLFKAVAPGDSIVVKAGHSFSEIVFSGLNEQGLLVCETFNKNEYERPVHYELDYGANGEPPKRVLEGFLADNRHYRIEVARLPFFSPKDGSVANVEISVMIDKTSTFDQFGLE